MFLATDTLLNDKTAKSNLHSLIKLKQYNPLAFDSLKNSQTVSENAATFSSKLS